MTVLPGVVIAGFVSAASAQIDYQWRFDRATEASGFALGVDSPGMTVSPGGGYAPASAGSGLVLDGTKDTLAFRERPALPEGAMTVGAWVAVDVPQRWGGIVGCVEDSGDHEKGWVLGFDERVFTFGLSTEGADDGNGAITYLQASTPYRVGRWHQVVATYDGEAMRIYVDGELAGMGEGQGGPILYEPDAPFVIGAYRDSNEHYRLDGRILEARVLSRAMSANEIRRWFDESSRLASLDAWIDTDWAWLVAPYLTWPTGNAISIMCETTEPTDAGVDVWHESGSPRVRIESRDSMTLHEFRVDGLMANEKYFYQITGESPEGVRFASETLSFRTASTPDRPFTFVAIGDTQAQPEVVKRVSDLAYMHRPNLVVLCGDLVTTGTKKEHWTGHFFPNMQPLLGRTPLVPVLGNHEQDARYYYDYMSLPEPEMWYSLKYGNAEFFLLDGNRDLGSQSEQLAWLRDALRASDATWKFAVLHQPPYTSDSDDYGDTFRGPSRRGDRNAQNIIDLLEAYGVDICFSGHVHDYERTFPIREDRVTSYEDGGVIYVTTAGGGGHLENFDPTNTWFGHKKARYHHFVYVAINGGELEFQAVDERGRLFDVMTLRKNPDGTRGLERAAP